MYQCGKKHTRKISSGQVGPIVVNQTTKQWHNSEDKIQKITNSRNTV